MNLVNAVIPIDPEMLSVSTRRIHARQLHSLTVALTRVPDDVTSVVLRIYQTLNSYVDIPASRRPDGTAVCYVIGTVFQTVGTFKYEIHATDARGNSTALGVGTVSVGEFSTSGQQVVPGSERLIQQIADRNGNLHSIVAVADETGNFTLVIDQN